MYIESLFNDPFSYIIIGVFVIIVIIAIVITFATKPSKYQKNRKMVGLGKSIQEKPTAIDYMEHKKQDILHHNGGKL